ncbi:hypothetical protein EYF80_042851 [Liparis tanakae]|uniref:Uncharacterized protein n=1 Tax=Liparis tanakae TaxID=230148 RepID=A0A4Z2G1E6_9TELE|nr:hypothetical protein EYF80_042851 [Liparis tanakae]
MKGRTKLPSLCPCVVDRLRPSQTVSDRQNQTPPVGPPDLRRNPSVMNGGDIDRCLIDGPTEEQE